MPMTRNDLLNAICDDGIMEISTNYLRPDQRHKREGGIAGFEICRGKSNEELLALEQDAKVTVELSRRNDGFDGKDYWYHRYYQLQIEWVINVLSAAMHGQGLVPPSDFTMRGYLKARDILGVKESSHG